MINRRTLIVLAAVTFVLLIASAAIGQDRDIWIIDDVAWFGFLGCALALVLMTLAVLVRSLARRTGSSRA